MTTTPSRGIRNNNPGNIRISKDEWQGLDASQPDKQFFTFKSPIYGIRAIARILINYQDKYSIRTIKGIISKWAPASENNTDAYISAVATSTGLNENDYLDLHNYQSLKPLVAAIILHENGEQPYSDDQLDKALVLAGVEPQQKPLPQTHTIRGAKVIASTGIVASASGILAQAAPAMPVLSTLSQLAQDNARGLLIIVGLLVTVAAGYITWARIKQRAKGIA